MAPLPGTMASRLDLVIRNLSNFSLLFLTCSFDLTMSYSFYGYEESHSALLRQQVDELKEKVELLVRNQIEEHLRVLKRKMELLERSLLEKQLRELRKKVELLEQEKWREKWRNQAIEDNQRQAL